MMIVVSFKNHTFTIAPSPPLNVRTQDVASTSITVTWEPPQYPNGVLLGYEVCYTSNGDSPSAVNVQNTSTAWKLTDMKPCTMYSISVRAKTVAGFGEKSTPVMISTGESGMYFHWTGSQVSTIASILDNLCSLNDDCCLF